MRDLQHLSLVQLTGPAEAWGQLSAQMENGQHTVDREIAAPLQTSWRGADADAAQTRLTRLSRNYEYANAESGSVSTLLSAAAEELAAQQKALQQALDDAQELGFTVADDGSVSYPPAAPFTHGGNTDQPPSDPGLLLVAPGATPTSGDPNEGKAQEIADRIDAAVRQATDIDEHYTAALGKLKADSGLDVTDHTWVQVAQAQSATAALAAPALHLDGIPSGDSPATNAAWWKSLSADMQREYLATMPDRIGALDGLPAETRDQANRVVMLESHAQLEGQLAALGSAPKQYLTFKGGEIQNPAWTQWNAQVSQLKGQLAGIESLQARLDGSGGLGSDGLGLPPAYLLGFDTKGNGHAILAQGNPDLAAHTAFFVPGTGSNMSNIGGDVHRMSDLWEWSQAMSTQPVSTITWLGYDAPQDLVQATTRSYADAAAPLLDKFSTGLAVAHQGAPGHITAIGHSYGSTVVGSAAIHGHLGVSDIVVAGSPGMEVGRASDLGVGNHVWEESAGWDPVPMAGRDFSGLPGIDPVTGDPVVPYESAFGAHRMATNTGGHSAYWNPGTLSLSNQAYVVTGNYGRVQGVPQN
jgi:hypothetical protein